MPAPISFFDMEALSSPASTGFYAPVPVTTGPNWQPGDIRVFFLQYFSGSPPNLGSNITWIIPPGYSSVDSEGVVPAPNPPTPNDLWWWGVSWRRLVAGDTDTFVTINRPDTLNYYNSALITVRGVDPTFTPSPTMFGFAGPTNNAGVPLPPATAVVSSVSVPAVGTVVTFMGSQTYTQILAACALGIPSGWTNLVSTPNSGLQYLSTDTKSATIAVAKSFSSSGSTGSITFPTAGTVLPWFSGATMFFRAAPDVSIAAGNASATATATTATLSTSTAVTITAGSATAASAASTAFNPLYGYWVSDPLALPGDPVTGSVVRWTQTIPAGTSVLVETSINNGASWDAPVVNGQVPRLATGDTTTRSVLVRATLTRTNASDPPPRVTTLEVQVSVDAGIDELIPVGHGMIDKVTVSAVGGSTGAGSTTSVTSSSAVISRGGGQTGGGTSIKIHVTDLSGQIKRNVWAMPFTLPSGMNYGDAAEAMVLNRLPSQTRFALSSTEHVTPLLVYGMTQGGDPWQDIQDLATAIGFEAFFDASGVFVFRPVPDPNVGDPVWTFDEDSNPLVAEASRELSSDQTFNHIIVVGQSTSSTNPVTAEAFDNTPSSPTYILGPYGEVTERLTFSLVTTQEQAQATADALLNNSLGAADTVTITCVPMPALEPGDIVKLNVSDLKANGTYMINSMTTSMSPADPQQLVCFRQSTNT